MHRIAAKGKTPMIIAEAIILEDSAWQEFEFPICLQAFSSVFPFPQFSHLTVYHLTALHLRSVVNYFRNLREAEKLVMTALVCTAKNINIWLCANLSPKVGTVVGGYSDSGYSDSRLQ